MNFTILMHLKKELEDSFRFIEPDEANMDCFGAKYASLLNSICTEFESVSRSLIKTKDSGVKVGDIGDIKKYLLQYFPKIVENEVKITRMNKTFHPFKNWKTSKLEWWDAYNSLKHNRISNYSSANLRNILGAMSALLVLVIYLARFRDSNNDLRTTNIFWMDVMPYSLITESGKLPDEN